MTILITGGCGFIGTNLTEHLLREGYDLRVTDFNLRDRMEGNVQYIRGDITDRDFVSSLFTEDTDTVIHLAGIVGVKNYLRNPSAVIDVNFESTRYIVDNARSVDADVVFSSTSEIYGKNPDPPWKEDYDRVLGSTSRSRWVYSSSKALSEHLLLAASETYGMRTVIFRLFNIYGRYQAPVNVVPRMITTLLKGERAQLYDGGSQTRCFTYIDDAVDAIHRLMAEKSIKRDYFNIGSSVEVTIKQLGDEILAEMGLNSDMIQEFDTKSNLGEQYEDIGRRVPDVGKIQEKIGWKAETDRRKGLHKTIEWYRENRGWWS